MTEDAQRVGGFLLEAQFPPMWSTAPVPSPVVEHAPVTLESRRVPDRRQRLFVQRAMDEQNGLSVALDFVLKLAGRLHRTLLAGTAARGTPK